MGKNTKGIVNEEKVRPKRVDREIHGYDDDDVDLVVVVLVLPLFNQ